MEFMNFSRDHFDLFGKERNSENAILQIIYDNVVWYLRPTYQRLLFAIWLQIGQVYTAILYYAVYKYLYSPLWL